jgi:hypothetical protein
MTNSDKVKIYSKTMEIIGFDEIFLWKNILVQLQSIASISKCEIGDF